MPSRNLNDQYSTNLEDRDEPRDKNTAGTPDVDDWSDVLEHIARAKRGDITPDDDVIEGWLSEDETPSENVSASLSKNVSDPAASPSKNVSDLEADTSKNVSTSPSKNVSGPGKPSSKNVSANKRRSPANDRKIVAKMRSYRPSDVSPAGTSSVSDSFSPYTSFESYIAPDTKPSPIPVWDHIGDYAKSVCAAAALVVDDNPAVAFSFNLTEEAIAKASPDGFLDAMKRPFDQNLKRAGIALPYFFAVDINDDGRLHLHGGFRYPLPARTWSMDRRLRRIFKQSFGPWIGPGRHKQLHFQALRDDGWATYSLKRMEEVQKLIGPRTFTITQDLGNEAKWFYGKLRSMMSEA